MKIKAPENHDLAQLHDELLAAKDAEGKPALIDPGHSLTYDGEDKTLLVLPVREGVKEADVRKVLSAHKPVERKTPKSRKELLDEWKAAPANKKTDALAAWMETFN